MSDDYFLMDSVRIGYRRPTKKTVSPSTTVRQKRPSRAEAPPSKRAKKRYHVDFRKDSTAVFFFEKHLPNVECDKTREHFLNMLNC